MFVPEIQRQISVIGIHTALVLSIYMDYANMESGIYEA